MLYTEYFTLRDCSGLLQIRSHMGCCSIRKYYLQKKENLKEFIEVCLHKRESEWDMVAVEGNVK